MFRASSLNIQRDYVVKFIDANDVIRSTWTKILGPVARLTNPHVVHIYDIFSENDSIVVLMELVDGKDVAELSLIHI